MSSICYGGKTLMQVVENNEEPFDSGYYADSSKYPFHVPQVYLEGYGENYYPQVAFTWSDDSVTVVRDQYILEYTKHNYVELLAEDENGNTIWVDGRTAPYEGCWGGKYLKEYRAVCAYTVTEYGLETLEKRMYKVVPDGVTKFDCTDALRVMELLGEEKFCSEFVMENRLLRKKSSSGQITNEILLHNTN